MAPLIDEITQGLVKGFDWAGKAVVDVANYFIDLYNESMLVRVGIEWLKVVWVTAFNAIKANVLSVIDVFSGLGQIVVAVLKGNFAEIPQIMRDTIENVKSNIVEAGTNIGDAISDGINNVVTRKKIAFIGLGEENVAAMETEATAVGVRIGTAMNQGINSARPILPSGTPGATPAIVPIPIPGAAATGEVEDGFDAVSTAATSMGGAISSAFSSGMDGVDDFGKALKDMAKDAIKGFLATAVAAAIASALESLPFPVNLIAAAGAGVAAIGLMAAVPALAGGGLAYGPTMAMVGDNPGARTDPEVIAPLSKLQGMQPKVVLVGKLGISMGELRLAIQNANDDYYRNY
jgi:hypothetical protein